MPSNSVSLIEKKDAKTFTIVSRSQRDLHRYSSEYESKNKNQFVVVTHTDLDLEDNIEELDRCLESIELDREYMADDIANILFNTYQEGEYEELLDDFCITASKNPQKDNCNDDGNFNIESHFSNLLSNLKNTEKNITNHNNLSWEETKEYFSKMKQIKQKKHVDFQYFKNSSEFSEQKKVEDKLGLLNEGRKIFHGKFLKTLAEYNSDEIGYINENEYISIDKNQELSKSHMNTLLNSFTDKKKNYKSNFVNNMNYVLFNIDNQGELDLNEENLYTEIPYIAQSMHEQWDCESILSTYSNLNNNPTIISRNLSKKKKINKKNGLHDSQIMETQCNILKKNKGIKREKCEEKGKKLARKNAVKQEKRKRRIEKRVMRTVFRNELSQITTNNAHDTIKGKNVFRY